MRRFPYLNALALLAMLLWSSNALAITLAPGFNTLEFVQWENRVGVNGTGGPIQVGDRFYGVTDVQVIRSEIAGNPNPFDTSSNPVHQLTGYFYTQVVAIEPAEDPENAIIVLGVPTSSDPNGVISDAERAAGTVFELYEDFTTQLNFTSVASSIATATDGSLFMRLAMNPSDQTYWWSEALLDPTGVAPGTFLGFSWLGLNVIGGSAASGLVPINDPREDRYDFDVQLYADSTLETNARRDGSVGVWAFTGDDPATIFTPEPATMMIMGSGLLGMFAVRRRNKKSV